MEVLTIFPSQGLPYKVVFFVNDVVIAARRRFQKRLRLVRCDVFRGVRRDLSRHDVDLVINHPKKH